MKHQLYRIALVAAATAGAAILVLAAPATRAVTPNHQAKSSQEKFADVTLTGCLIQGSASSVFVLENAKATPGNDQEKGRSYLLTAAAQDLDIEHHLNQEVTVTGAPDTKTAPLSSTKPAEKDMPKFPAKSLIMVAEKCQPANR